jgi:hypothetical protein
MNLPLPPDDALLISRAIDGDLTDDEQRLFDERLARDEAFRDEVESRRRLQTLVRRMPGLAADPGFVNRVMTALPAHERETGDLLPFPRRYLPVAAVAVTAVVAVATFMVLESRIPLLRFWEQQSATVRQAYEQTVAQGNFWPLLGDLDDDRTIQFAFTGTLPIDEEKGATLKVDDRAKDGYRIEVQKDAARPKREVTVAEFMSAVKPSETQRRALDSVLNAAREELQTAVLVGANDEVAIKADLRRLNRAMVSGLAAVLEPDQRAKMSRFMTVRDAPYVLFGSDAEPSSSQEIVREMRAPRERHEFVVLRPDSLLITHYHLDAAELHRHAEQVQVMSAELAARRDRMLRRWVDQPSVPEIPAIAPDAMARVNVRSRRDRLSIEVADSVSGRVMFFNITVAPRVWVDGGEPETPEAAAEAQGIEFPGGRVVIAPRVPMPPRVDSAKVKRRALPIIIE